MAFNVVAQLQIQAPTNIGKVASQIRGALKNITADVQVNISPTAKGALDDLNASAVVLTKNLQALKVAAVGVSSTINSFGRSFTTVQNSATGANNGLSSTVNTFNNLTRATTDAANATEEFGRAAGLAGRRFLGFTLVAGGIVGFIASVKSAITEALRFEREFIKISQIGGATTQELRELNSEITRISTSFGVSSKDILATSITLRQAGLEVKQVTTALEALAKTTLAPSFENIKNTTEGAIAIMAQFKVQTEDLEGALSSINSVANAFAVESKDIIEAVRRGGGAFKSIGGD